MRYLGILILLIGSVPARGDMVPFVIPAEVDPKSEIAFKVEAIPVDGPRVEARDGHFYLGKDRWRAWGVNLCFAANFPPHDQAEKIARRLGAFGVNSVRFHHMDSTSFPRGIWDPKDNLKLSAEALDRLDYLLDQLARNGIRANINLHVSRSHARALKLAQAEQAPAMDKMVDIFTPELIEAQRRYARDLLGHVNAYRKVRYADDPAVAFVEISNEDSLFMWGADQELQTLPSHYADLLQGQYQAYLKAKYGADDKLRAAWAQGSQPLGESLVRDPAFRLGPGQSAWTLEQHESARATAKPLPDSGVRIEIAQNDPTSWHLQFNQAGLKIRKDQYYTVLFKARADQPRTVVLGVSQAHQPWGGLGLSKPVSLTKDLQEFRAGFVASADDDNARVSFILGQSNIALEIDQLELRPGGIEGLGKDETLAGKVALFGQCESRPRLLDRLCFFAQAEKTYFDGMCGFIKKDLGCKALVTGTIAFGPLGLYAQSGMDYIDAHAYWQHPHFPGRPWDPKDWLVEQKAMVDDPEGSTLYGLACQRLAGKPFTVSEYNHPAPNDYQAECVPMIAAFAALQDWDGVWLFAYNHSDEFATDRIRGFFDIDGNPAKWGFMPSGAMMFSKAGVPPSPKILQRGLTPGGSIVELAELQLRRGIDLRLDKQELSIADKYPIGARMFCRLGGRNEVQGTSTVGKDVIPDLGAFDVHIVKDFTPPNSPTPAHFYVISVTPLDAKRPDQCRRLLVTAMGRCENTGMKFTADRRSVGTDWGKAPVLIEPVTMDFGLPVTGPDWRCHALSPDGLPAGEVPLKSENNRLVLPLSAQHKTMWYLLTR